MGIAFRSNVFLPGALLFALLAGGCGGGMERIDQEVKALLAETSGAMGAREPAHGMDGSGMVGAPERDPTDERPPTMNPAAAELSFVAQVLPMNEEGQADAQEVIDRLESYSRTPAGAVRLDLPAALAYACAHSREYRFAEEEYVLSALRVLIERHQWGPRFFDDVSATVLGGGDEGMFDTALSLVNELRVTQRLPYGGEVSARALARATEDLHERVSGENVQSAEIILGADIPLLRGAGMAARENLIQAERSLVYAARDFERFRREFLFDVAREYLDLTVAQRRIANAEQSVASFQQVESQQKALLEAGRTTPFEADEATNRTLEAIDSLNTTRENYRLALDRFKVRLGMPVDVSLVVEADTIGVPTPKLGMEEAIYASMSFRLDLQNERDQVDDAERAVGVARNNLLGDLDLQASVSIPTDDDNARSGLDFEAGSASFQAGVTYGLALDREIERLSLRQSEINLERAHRDYDRFRDEVAIAVRGAVRGIDAALFSVQIQERNVEIALQRVAAIEADPARADIRQRTDAIGQLDSARNARDSARRDLEVAVLRYLLETGQLRVGPAGNIEPLRGMELGG